ncbi:MAG: general secretion pathway protein GspB [Ramlibacter sp.]
MSYILDALRKADAQRERDPARGIHAQAANAPAAAAAPDKLPSRLMALAAGLALIGVGLVWWRMDSVQAPVVVVAPAPVAAVPVSPIIQPPPAPAVVAPAPRPVAVEARKPAVKAPVPVPAVAPAPPAAPDRIVALAELPADVQRELPKLAISGAVYSDNPAQRMLIANGQVVNEGAELAPGLVLEQIRPKSAVLKFRGLRFSLGY